MKFRVVVTGDRELNDYRFVADRLATLLAKRLPEVVILHGGCRGADMLADMFAIDHRIDQEPYPVTPDEWTRLGGAAGPLRNGRMIAANAHAVVAFATKQSRGTRDAIAKAKAARLPLVVYEMTLDVDGLVTEWKTWDANRGG